MKAVAYVRVSTKEQGESRNGLEAQSATCSDYAKLSGLELVEIVEEVESAAKMTNRPLLIETLRRLKAGEVEVLIVSKLDRLSRSVVDLMGLLDKSEREGWSLVILDLGLETVTPTGRLQASIQASVAEFERRRIGERTREGLAAAKARGVKLGGSAPVVPCEIVEEVVRLSTDAGLTLRQIADTLNARGVPTRSKTGKGWSAGSVSWLLKSARGQSLQAA
jgi:DNA invertase Pin-like site-specific DNA recombinase